MLLLMIVSVTEPKGSGTKLPIISKCAECAENRILMLCALCVLRGEKCPVVPRKRSCSIN